MSSHNLSHADVFSAGNALFFNKSNQPNQPRGLPIAPMAFQNAGNFAADDPDGIATSQTPSAGGVQSLVLDGAFAAAGVATLPNLGRSITLTSAANDSARSFTITGTDVNGDPQVSVQAGPNTATVENNRHWETITSITVDDDTAGAITVGSGPTLGLRTRSAFDPAGNVVVFAVAVEDGAVVLTTFSPGVATSPPTSGTASPRISFTPTQDVDVAAIWIADLTKDGKGENFTG